MKKLFIVLGLVIGLSAFAQPKYVGRFFGDGAGLTNMNLTGLKNYGNIVTNQVPLTAGLPVVGDGGSGVIPTNNLTVATATAQQFLISGVSNKVAVFQSNGLMVGTNTVHISGQFIADTAPGFIGSGSSLTNIPNRQTINGSSSAFAFSAGNQVRYVTFSGYNGTGGGGGLSTESSEACGLSIRPPFYITNLVWQIRQGALNLTTNVYIRVYTNGVYAAGLDTILLGTGATADYFTNNFSGSISFPDMGANYYTNTFSYGLSNTTATAQTTWNMNWSCEAVKP